jgi:amino acid adenylation domain-containing protein
MNWNQTESDYPDRCVHQLFESQAKETPEKIAIVSGKEEWSYGELNRRSHQIADCLRHAGVGQGSLVGICMERSVWMLAGVIGILKSGAAYLPMDPSYPGERLRFMLEDSHCSLLLIDRINPVPGWRGKALGLDKTSKGIGREAIGNPSEISIASDIAYVIYTSGSTGRPKGISIGHRSLTNFLYSMKQRPGLSENDIVLALTTLSFDIAGLELFLPLIVGARVVIADRETATDGRRLGRELERSQATVMQGTPSIWRLLLESGWKGNPNLKILCGGEAWPQKLAYALLLKCGSLWNMYGPTETTIWSGVHQIQSGQDVRIGHPIANTQFYVVDAALHPVPIGVPGELLIGGDGVGIGYLNLPELTEAKFIPDSFRRKPGARLFRTGDRVRCHPNGEIEFLGRMDDQIKIRGYRVELGEIEKALERYPAVRQAAASTNEIVEGDVRIEAYIALNDGTAVSAEELRKFLRHELPDFMIPAAYRFVDRIPLTLNGKIDRKALPKIPSDCKFPAVVLPRNNIESRLIEMWSGLLGTHGFGVQDNFFDIGGHSLLAARLFAEIERQFGTKLPLSTLYRAGSVEQLADILQQKTPFVSWSSLVPIGERGSRAPLFLVHGAEGNVLLYRALAKRLGDEQPVYGLQSRGLDGKGDLLRTIEDMAAHYIREIRAAHPDGPYCLGGYCLGGAIALEMARQLAAQGAEVPLVAMFETYNMQAMPRPMPRWLPLLHLFQDFQYHYANLLLAKDRGLRFFGEKWEVAKRRLNARLGTANRCALSLKKTNDNAADHYAPENYSGRVVLFRPKIYFRGLDDASFGWSKILGGGLEVQQLPFYPRGMLMEPFVQLLAERLSSCLNRSIEPAPGAADRPIDPGFKKDRLHRIRQDIQTKR